MVAKRIFVASATEKTGKNSARKKMTESIPIPKHACLGCGHVSDMAFPINGPTSPQEGDVTVCAYCAEIMVFNHDGSVRKPAEEDKIPPSALRAAKYIKENPMKRT